MSLEGTEEWGDLQCLLSRKRAYGMLCVNVVTRPNLWKEYGFEERHQVVRGTQGASPPPMSEVTSISRGPPIRRETLRPNQDEQS